MATVLFVAIGLVALRDPSPLLSSVIVSLALVILSVAARLGPLDLDEDTPVAGQPRAAPVGDGEQDRDRLALQLRGDDDLGVPRVPSLDDDLAGQLRGCGVDTPGKI